MSLQTAYTTARVIETLENYAQSDLVNETVAEAGDPTRFVETMYSDDYFWHTALKEVEDSWDRKFRFPQYTLSEHVARVPGLYYHPQAQHYKNLPDTHKEYVSDRWTHYSPPGKSQKILGGIGTLQIPPTLEDWRIASISSGNNASLGIPVLIHEEVWQHYQLKEGQRLALLTAPWKRMDASWARRFYSMRGIPKGYLVVDHPDQLQVEPEIYPTIYHPFTIMEYDAEGSLFYDFVFVTVDSSDPDFRNQIRAFLGEYRYFQGRHGNYLIEPFVNHPLLYENDVMYHSPEDLRKENAASGSHLNLIVERIKRERFNQLTLDEIKVFMDNHMDIDDLKTCSDDILINPNSWFGGGRVYDESANLLNRVIERKKVEELVDVLSKYGLTN
ncbi:hypothetical protein GGR26_003058 [Lewinella marina]|uniref:Uncharacterized protein n=1 Tax=Neolewinella marina TaxID=438751 RepID=A0A2G0CEJ7_9BACT|nr:hypothetical protein [Neolewinella marina]NJB87278.1 hypothetical protein [Neolewinella marina]PHK98398.1 hypothetical protein CGL56_11940 [Neolewinella marina]